MTKGLLDYFGTISEVVNYLLIVNMKNGDDKGIFLDQKKKPMEKIVKYVKYHLEEKGMVESSQPPCPIKMNEEIIEMKWDRDFLQDMYDTGSFYSVMDLVNNLGMKLLFTLMIAFIASKLTGKTIDEMREVVGTKKKPVDQQTITEYTHSFQIEKF